MRWLWIPVVTLSMTLAGACNPQEQAEPAPPPEPAERQREDIEEPASAAEASFSIGRAPTSEAEQQAVDRARQAAQHLGRTVRARLMEAMQQGPEAAVRVCASEAQALTRKAAEEQGARVGRSSLRLRNPENEGPEWVRAWLHDKGERPAEGVEPAVGISSDPPVARFVGPIAIEGPCLMCHGPSDAIPAPVRTILSEHYPNDRATGYRLGDLRGAIWGEVPLE